MGDLIPTEPDLSLLQPSFHPSTSPEPPRAQSTIKTLHLDPHVEGGYFIRTDTSPISIPIPPASSSSPDSTASPRARPLSSNIFYYLSPRRPAGSFHRNRSRIVHTLHRGRGRYVLIHPGRPREGVPARVESFVVGQRIEEGERLQWVVEGGVWKASFLLDEGEDGEDGPGGEDNPGLLITETVVPGFDYADHEFLSLDEFRTMFPDGKAAGLEWLVRKEEPKIYHGLEEDGKAQLP